MSAALRGVRPARAVAGTGVPPGSPRIEGVRILASTLTLVAILVGCRAVRRHAGVVEVGRRVGRRRLTRDTQGLAKGAGAAEAAVFALLGLLIAFTFSNAAARFEGRRHLITDEANAIGTAYLRIGLLPGDVQPEMKDLFRRYTEVRSTTYLDAEDEAATQAKLAEAAALQGRIWEMALAASQRPEVRAQTPLLVLSSLNDMIDITTTRVMATRNHPPLVVFLLLGGLGLVGALLVGYDTSINSRPELAPRRHFRGDPVADGVRDRGSRIAATRTDSRQCGRSGPRRSPEKHALRRFRPCGTSPHRAPSMALRRPVVCILSSRLRIA